MNRIYSFYVGTPAIMLGIVVAVGCAGPTSYKPTVIKEPPAVTAEQFTETSVMPSSIGSTWIYTFDTITQTAAGTKPESGTMKFTIEGSKDTPKGKVITLVVSKNEAAVDRQVWQLTPKGVYQLTAGTTNMAFTPPQPLLLLPIKGNEKFTWKGKGTCPDGLPGTMRVSSNVRGVEPIDLVSGKDNALAVESNTDFQSSKLKARLGITTWYKPNVGIVRLKQSLVARGGIITTTLKLVSGPK